MRTSTRVISSLGLALAGLLLAGCGGDEAIEEPTGESAEESTESTESASPERENDSDSATEQDTADEAEAPQATFDPDEAVPFTGLEVDGELIFPDGPMPDTLVVPAGATVLTYDSEMGDNEQYHNGTGSLRVDDPDAEPEQVMAFFPQHLDDADWELAEERDNGMQVWERPHPDERVWTQQFRVETVKSGEQATIRWWFTNNG